MAQTFTLAHVGYMLEGVLWTLILSALAFVLGGVAGFGMLLLRISRFAVVRHLSFVVVQIIQGIPLLVILFAVYFGLGILGVQVPPLLAAGVAMMIYCAAFLAEIWRGCVASIPKGQWEASGSLALSFGEQLRHVILPQAVRIAIAPTVGFLVQVIKGTALASVIGFVELTKAGSMISNATFQPFVVFSCVALLYFVLCFPVSLYAKTLERKTHGRRA